MSLLFLWACKHFCSKHISCKMLEPHSSSKSKKPTYALSRQPGGGSGDPTLNKLAPQLLGGHVKFTGKIKLVK